METTKMIKLNNVIPVRAIHPGGILGDELKERGIKQKDFATRIGMRDTHLSELIKGKRNITTDIAIQLEKALDIPFDNWMSLQNRFDYDSRMIDRQKAEECEAMRQERACKELFNLQEIYKRLNIAGTTCKERIDGLKNTLLYDLLQIQSLESESIGYFKRSDKLSIDARNMRTWLVLARWEAEKAIVGNKYSIDSIEVASKEISRMANDNTLSIDGIKECLNRYGIAYVEVPKLPQTPIDAYSAFMKDHPVIVVTYRHDDKDKLAFDILHELGHIKLHMKEGRNSFISIEGSYSSNDPLEMEANEYARDCLIPKDVWKRMMSVGSRDLYPYAVANVIAREASKFGISKSIAVARYKHDSHCYDIRAHRSPKIFD